MLFTCCRNICKSESSQSCESRAPAGRLLESSKQTKSLQFLLWF